MFKADTSSNTTRRALALGVGAFASVGLTAGAAATVADAALPSPHPDAELIAMGREAAPLIAEAERLAAQWFALPPGPNPDLHRIAAAEEPIVNRLEELFDRALELPAITHDGLRAKAILVQHEMRTQNRVDGELVFDGAGSEGAWALIDDLLRMGRA
jgi:hypothetical protein